ncbi:uncharacterized protein LOC119083486 [Bradysia coprophila]|uniref:uncharacterized protein LOC119083486 n=1 Tax=Bradysia coprophila TaxID=38358 RepID=UPI00187D7F3F|nr:uncharacterized protein LOC119083486 [Bradysia coprophila]
MLNSFLKSNLLTQFVSVFDVLFALIVVAPLVVTFWSTTWMLYDAFILPSDPVVSGFVSWAFGFFGQMILMFHQDAIKRFLNFEKRSFLNIFCLKLYALFLGHTFVSFWRGVWMCVDATSSKDLGVVCSNIVQNIITLMIMKAFRNTLVPPFIVLTDTREQYSMRTLLEKHKADGSFRYFFDCMTTMFVEMLVAFIWHDFWFIHDSNIFPHDLFYSALSSLVFGYSLALICFTIQSCVGAVCEKHDDQKVFIFDVFAMVSLLSAINVWRGVWSFVAYFTDGNKEWILILNTLAWGLLMIVNCTFSLSAKDVLKDAEKPGKCCTEFETRYLTKMLFKKTDEKSDVTRNISTRL